MGYTITIGEAEIFYDADDPAIWIEATSASDENAPDHDKFTGKGNARSPGYSVWSDFCKATELTTLFFGGGWDRELRGYRPCPDDFHRETPLFSSHPGVQPITQKDAEHVGRKLTEYRRKHPDAIPGFWEREGEDNGTDPVLARLVWLEFWMRWALTNCKRPIIQNG